MSEKTTKRLKAEVSRLQQEITTLREIYTRAVDIQVDLEAEDDQVATATFADKQEFEQWLNERILNEVKALARRTPGMTSEAKEDNQ